MARNKFKKIKIGVEVECIINEEKINFLSYGGYHSGSPFNDKEGKTVRGWRTQSDSSINYGKSFSSPKGVEFVSTAFKSKRDFFKGIDNFIKCMSCDGQYELKEVLEINDSCGCHVHISKGGGKNRFAKKVHSYIYEQATKDFFKLLNASKLPQYVKKAVVSQYYRDYARKCDKNQFEGNRINRGADRGSEWNFCSERSGRGLEWRSFNLRDVKTWKDFKLLMSIAFKTIEPLILSLNKWQKGNIHRKEIIFSEREDKEQIIKIKNKEKNDEVIVVDMGDGGEKEFLIKKDKDGIVKINKRENMTIKMGGNLKRMLESAIGGGENL